MPRAWQQHSFILVRFRQAAMRTVSLVCLVLGAGAARISRKTATKSISGVPIMNYRYRHLQADAQDGGHDWVLKFKAGVNDQQISKFCGSDAGQGLCHTIGHPSAGGLPLATVHATELKLEKLLEQFASLLEWVEPDTPVDIEPEEEEEVQAGNVWGHETIGLERAGFSGDGVHIYVMDTGIRSTHNDFEGRSIPTVDTVANSGFVVECGGDLGCAGDTNGHGTHVAGTAGGKLYGVAKKATLHAMKVCCGSGSNVYGGMDFIAQKAIKPAVMTMSLGSYSTPEASRVAVDAVVAPGVTVIVSAGNRGTPSCEKSYTFIASAIGVGASDESNKRASFSNYGECNAIFAPGVSTVSASFEADIGYSIMSGTSMAAPMVAGVTAMLLEEDGSRSPQKIRELLRSRGRAGVLSELLQGDPNILLSAAF